MAQPSRTTFKALMLCLAGFWAFPTLASAAASPPADRAGLKESPASTAAERVADWVIASGDSHGLPFAIVDKVAAEVFVYERDGSLRGAAPVLVGLARGDDSVRGIGQRKLSSIRPAERTTPAGRFVAALGQDLGTKDVLWVDYDAGVSLHRVITTNPKERRLQRLATPTPLDNRISYGCINVPEAFFDKVVEPTFSGTDGIVYILPEVRSIRDVFPAYLPEHSSRTLAVTAVVPAR